MRNRSVATLAMAGVVAVALAACGSSAENNTPAAGGGTSIYSSSSLQRRLRDVNAITQHFLLRPSTLVTAGAALAEGEGVLRVTELNGWLECTVDTAEKRLPQLLRLLHLEGTVVRDVQVREPDLEEVFVELAK